jgi:glucosyl-dolichyl phosphate glucuronosyltransferase
VAVIVCAYTLARRDEVLACVESLQRQSLPPTETIVVVDYNDELGRWLAARLPEDVRVEPNTGPRGLSGARNMGIRSSSQPIVAFIDDDAVAEPGWLAHLCRALSQEDVIGAGGHSLPLWEGESPAWFPEEFLWVVGCSYGGMARNGPVRNGLGGCMAFRAEVFDRVGGFDHSVGRIGRRPVGGEETELCIRAQRGWPGTKIVVVEEATLHHRVSRERQHPAYFARRCFYEGASKALIRRLGGREALTAERSYATRTLPKAIARELAGGVRRGRMKRPLQRAGAIVVGLTLTTAGFALGSLFYLLRRPRAQQAPPIARSAHSNRLPFAASSVADSPFRDSPFPDSPFPDSPFASAPASRAGRR